MGRNTLCWAMSQYRSWKWFPFPRSAVGIKASTCYLVVQLSLTAWAGNLCTFKCLRARNKAPASLPFCWHPAFTESRRGAVSVPDSGLPRTWGALMLAEVCSSPRGFCWGSIYSFSHMAIKHLSAPAVLSRAWLCAVTGAGQLCLNTSPRVPSWLLQMVWHLLAHGITSQNRLPPPGHALGCCSPLKPYCHHVSVRAVLPPTMPQCYCRKAPICKAESDLPLPLRCFQASVLSSVDSSSSSISRGIHSSLLSFNTAVIVVSSSPSYGFSLQQEQSPGITEPTRTCLPWNTHEGVQRISPAPRAGGRGDFASCCCLSLCISAGGLWSLQDSGQSVVSYLL